MNQTVQYIKIPQHRRVLIVSDIHGNLVLFKKLLKEQDFSRDDVLIINGDISEKGPDSIGLFKYLIELEKTHTVYFTLGNCDHLVNHFNDYSKIDGMTRYMNGRQATLLNEIGNLLGEASTYLDRVAYAKEVHQDILDLVARMPIAIETDDFICVHAAYHVDGSIHRPYNISERDFFNSHVTFEKPVIVGHYPVCLYSDDEINHNARFDREKNIISLDGGNMMKALGQLNVAIYQDGEFHFAYSDLLETIQAPHDQRGVKGVHINWANNGIEITNQGDLFSDVYHPYSNQTIAVYNAFLDFQSGSLKEDTTNATLDVKQGDAITIQYETPSTYYIKCRGYEGWYTKIKAS